MSLSSSRAAIRTVQRAATSGTPASASPSFLASTTPSTFPTTTKSIFVRRERAPILFPAHLPPRAFSTTCRRCDGTVTTGTPPPPPPLSHDEVAAVTAVATKTAAGERPRWSYTPERMRAPFNPNIPKNPARSIWEVNSDPDKLDQMYTRLLGHSGPQMLQPEVKWLAVTHKSFDQGRRGFNDRLAYFGRTAVAMECGMWISEAKPKTLLRADSYGRHPFEHSALLHLDNLNFEQPLDIVSKYRLEQLATKVGLDKVVRWKPKAPEALTYSGIQLVLNGAIYAIVGAVYLQHGALVGNKVVRDRILKMISPR